RAVARQFKIYVCSGACAPAFVLCEQFIRCTGTPSIARCIADSGGFPVYAVIETGGRHYRVAVGDTISVEKVTADAGDQIEIDRVVMISGDSGVSIGTPVVEGATVKATVREHYRGPKITVFKMKPKKRYRRKT